MDKFDETDKSRKKKRGRPPSKKDADEALELIKALQKINDEDLLKNKVQEEEFKIQQEQERLEQERIQIAQERVKRKLRENVEKKNIQQTKEKVKMFLEAPTTKKSKIKWKSSNGGSLLTGYVEDKIFFEIKRGLNLFTLYIKDKQFIETKKIKSYQGCSTNLQKLKGKSDKFI